MPTPGLASRGLSRVAYDVESMVRDGSAASRAAPSRESDRPQLTITWASRATEAMPVKRTARTPIDRVRHVIAVDVKDSERRFRNASARKAIRRAKEFPLR